MSKNRILVLLSVAIAVVLWAAATLLEQYLQAPEPVPVTQTTDDFEDPDAATEDDAEPVVAGCQETEDRLVRIVEESRYCTTDDDCTLFDYGYPLDCMSSVARSRISELREEYRKYDERCEHRVFFDCPTGPYVRLPVCRDNRCEVELDSREPSLEPLGSRRRD